MQGTADTIRQLRVGRWWGTGEDWRPPPELTIDVWSERTIVLPRSVAAEPGPIDLDRTPYLREILQMATDPEVEEITLQASTQTGKTMACMLIVLYYLGEDPWPCLHVAPREDDAIAINVDRYQKIIHESPNLRRCLTGAANDMTREAIRLNGTALTFVGANSPSGLASRAICCLVLDETDKYPPFAQKEADPIALARERTRTFINRKTIKASSPTTARGYIHQEYLASDQRRFHVPCPHCGHYQPLVMGSGAPGGPGIHWPAEERDPERIIDRRLAWYECESCHGRIGDLEKPVMLRGGVWCPETQRVGPGGSLLGPAPPRRRVGYHLTALYSPWLTWSRIAAEFLNSKDYPALLMNFRNSWLAEIWEDTVAEVRDEVIRSRAQASGYTSGWVPVGARVLTAGVDVQLDHFWYTIRAWGYLGESWLVRCGRVESWEALEAVLLRTPYPVVGKDGQVLWNAMIFVDSAYRTEEVYNFCRRTGCQALKGDRRVLRHFQLSHYQDATGATGTLVNVNVAHYKEKIHRLIRTADGEPEAWHLPMDIEEEYIRQMVAEQRVLVTDKRTGQTRHEWRLASPGAQNHLFDTEVYALVAAEALEVERPWRTMPVAPTEAADQKAGAPSRAPARQPSFMRPKIELGKVQFFSR